MDKELIKDFIGSATSRETDVRRIADKLRRLQELPISTLRQLETHKDTIDQKPNEEANIIKFLLSISNKFVHMLGVLGLKISLVADGGLKGRDGNNPISYALCVRSLIEQVGSLAYLDRELNKATTYLEKQKQYKNINEKLSQLDKKLDRLYYGTTTLPVPKNIKNKVHVDDLLRALKNHMPSVNDHYNFLSDFVHPNYGSNLFVSSGNLGEGQITMDTPRARDLVDRIGVVFWVYSNQAEEIFDGLTRYSFWMINKLDAAMDEHTKVNSIFTLVTAKYVGDGQSKETAFFFTKARSHTEHIMLQEQVLGKFGVDPGSRALGGVEDGFVFDKYESKKREFWFKIPVTEL